LYNDALKDVCNVCNICYVNVGETHRMRGTDTKSEILFVNLEEIMPLRHLDRQKNNMIYEIYFFKES
jgi:mannose/fructose/N-acetylgalactosamine-specific phosphotransferase system component IIB